MNVLVTGGASGLGAEITRKIAENAENKVYFTFHSSLDKAKEIEKIYPNTEGLRCDFHKSSDIEALLRFIQNSEIQVLVNNAYTSAISPTYFHKTSAAQFAENFQANIMPVISITQQAILSFRKQKFGKIINILSSAIIGNPPIGWSEYTAGKAYLESLSKSWVEENKLYNITSNSISPSFMQTSLTSFTDERVVEVMNESHPLKRILTPSEVADSVLYLVNCSQQINGVNLIINAGFYVV